jgi:trehalose-6-phosphate synthase
VLSEFAGAAWELRSALRVNPYDISALASTIHQAMLMPEREQQSRMEDMRRVVATQSVQRWADDFLNDLSARAPSRCSLAVSS